MDSILSPLVKSVIDMGLSYLISKGILDIQYRDTVLSLINSLVAGLVVVIPSVYGMYKVVDASKHKTTIQATRDSVTVTTPVSQASQPATLPEQTGLPKSS